MIDAKDVAHYREHGYLVVPDVLDAATVDSLRREMEAILEGARAVTAHTDVYDLEPGHRPDAPRVRRVKTPHKFFDGFKRL
jgi:phytanoyl-CoA hydroxylase